MSRQIMLSNIRITLDRKFVSAHDVLNCVFLVDGNKIWNSVEMILRKRENLLKFAECEVNVFPIFKSHSFAAECTPVVNAFGFFELICAVKNNISRKFKDYILKKLKEQNHDIKLSNMKKFGYIYPNVILKFFDEIILQTREVMIEKRKIDNPQFLLIKKCSVSNSFDTIYPYLVVRIRLPGLRRRME